MININLTVIVINLLGFSTLFILGLTIWKWDKIDTITRIEGIGVVILSLVALNTVYYDFSKPESNKETLIRDSQQSQTMFQREEIPVKKVASGASKVNKDYNDSKNSIESEANNIHNSIK